MLHLFLANGAERQQISEGVLKLLVTACLADGYEPETSTLRVPGQKITKIARFLNPREILQGKPGIHLRWVQRPPFLPEIRPLILSPVIEPARFPTADFGDPTVTNNHGAMVRLAFDEHVTIFPREIVPLSLVLPMPPKLHVSGAVDVKELQGIYERGLPDVVWPAQLKRTNEVNLRIPVMPRIDQDHLCRTISVHSASTPS